MKRSLPRLAHLADDEIPDAGVSLEETRQVVAADYGYSDWASLESERHRRRPLRTIEDLADLEDDEIRQVIVRLGRDRLAVIFKAVSERLKDRFGANMSDDEWQALAATMEELGPMSLGAVEAAQAQLVQKFRNHDTLV